MSFSRKKCIRRYGNGRGNRDILLSLFYHSLTSQSWEVADWHPRQTRTRGRGLRPNKLCYGVGSRFCSESTKGLFFRLLSYSLQKRRPLLSLETVYCVTSVFLLQSVRLEKTRSALVPCPYVGSSWETEQDCERKCGLRESLQGLS